jgi:hypothetical protein
MAVKRIILNQPLINIGIFLIIFIIIISFLKLFVKKLGISQKSQDIETMKTFDAPYLSQGASSIDSEKQFAETGDQWKGQSNKCYSCERDMQARCGNQCAYNATKTKCFDC